MLDLIRSNKRRSAALVLAFVAVLVLVGAAVGLLLGHGLLGTSIALAVSSVMAFASYWKADAIALAVSRAKPADPQQYQRLHNIVEGLCIASGLPKPRVYVIDDAAPNAFATGRDPAHGAPRHWVARGQAARHAGRPRRRCHPRGGDRGAGSVPLQSLPGPQGRGPCPLAPRNRARLHARAPRERDSPLRHRPGHQRRDLVVELHQPIPQRVQLVGQIKNFEFVFFGFNPANAFQSHGQILISQNLHGLEKYLEPFFPENFSSGKYC